MRLDDKIEIVRNILKDRNVAIGFSGGADSTLLAYLSSEVSKNTLAITIDNHLFPTGFLENTERTCEEFGINHEIIDIDFYRNDTILSNSSKRCFYCRDLMYSTIRNVAFERGYDFICDGNNISDLVQNRPGILVTYKNSFKTPFIEANLTSAEIHEYLNKNAISYSKSTTCLATRIPTDTEISLEKIGKIRHLEDYILTNTNCEIVKFRDFGQNGIIEADDISCIFEEDKFKQINSEAKGQGFEKVCLDLAEIDDNDIIELEYLEGSFIYNLPYTIDINATQRQIENVISYNEDKIKLENITIYENGTVEGHNFNTPESALDSFMEILKKIRRNV